MREQTIRPCRPPCDCDAPPRPAVRGGFLIQQIMGSGKCWQRCRDYELVVTGLPRAARPPLRLLSVSACGQEPYWERVEDCPCHDHNALMLNVTIPLTCEVADACGCRYTGAASAEAQVKIRLHCPQTECWRHNVIVLPCVRLCGRVCESDTGRFCAPLEVALDAYVVRYCAAGGGCAPACPELPLYPQPRGSEWR